MRKEISKRTILITGAGSRIGAHLADGFASAGWNVAVHYRTSCDEARMLCGNMENVAFFQADLTIEEQRLALFRAVQERFEVIDCLLNNASHYARKNLLDISEAEFFDAFGINCLVPLLLSQLFVKQGHAGSIINMLDCRITGIDSKSGAYLLAKKTLRDITEALALQCAPNIRVNGIAPGIVMAPPGARDTTCSRLVQKSPLKKLNDCAEILSAALFLANSLSITGTIVDVDGGLHLNDQDWCEPEKNY